MALNTIRRLAADILGVGEGRVRFKPDSIDRVKEALTRQDVRDRIQDGIIYKLPVLGRRKNPIHHRKKKGSIRGHPARLDKVLWMERVRAQRKYLRALLAEKKIDRKFNRLLYAKIKSGIFRSKAAMNIYLEENHLLATLPALGEKSGGKMTIGPNNVSKRNEK